MLLTEKQLSLFTKIVSTKLTKAELKEVTAKAEEILNRRSSKRKEV